LRYSCVLVREVAGEVSGTEKEHRRHSQHGLVQYIANVVTIVSGLGSVIALVSGQYLWAVPTVAALAFAVYSLRNRRWKPAAFGLAVVMLAAAAGAASYPQHGGHKSPRAGTTNPGAADSSPAPAAAAASSPAASPSPKLLVNSDVTLERHAAVDVDQAEPQVLQNQTGADGNLDLYFDPSADSIIAYDAEGVLNPGQGITDPHAACADQFDPASSDRNVNPYGYVSEGSGFCFRTSSSRMAYAVVVATDQPEASEAPQAVTLHVIVWDNALP
jgi:hypothetical protein